MQFFSAWPLSFLTFALAALSNFAFFMTDAQEVQEQLPCLFMCILLLVLQLNDSLGWQPP